VVNAPAPFSGLQELPDDVKCCCWVAPMHTPWLKLTSVSSDNHTATRGGCMARVPESWELARPLPSRVTAGTHCFDSGVLLEFQIGREKVLFFFFYWITKRTLTSWALDFQRQRFKDGLVGFGYSTCFRVGLGKENNPYLTKTGQLKRKTHFLPKAK